MANEDSMSQAEIVLMVKDIHRRVQAMGQILPTLATREEMNTAIAEQSNPSITRLREEGDRIREHVDERLQARLEEQGARTRQYVDERLEARLQDEGARTRQDVDQRLEVRLEEQGARTRRHMEIIAERMHDDVRLIAESQVGAEERFERHRAAHAALAQRVSRLEDAAGTRGPRK